MDLSKAFDTLNHDLIAKLHPYGFGSYALELIKSYLLIHGKGLKLMSVSVHGRN